MFGFRRSFGFMNAVTVALAVLLTGCGRRETVAEKAAREGRYLMVMGADPQTLDPHVATGFPEYQAPRAPLIRHLHITKQLNI